MKVVADKAPETPTVAGAGGASSSSLPDKLDVDILAVVGETESDGSVKEEKKKAKKRNKKKNKKAIKPEDTKVSDIQKNIKAEANLKKEQEEDTTKKEDQQVNDIQEDTKGKGKPDGPQTSGYLFGSLPMNATPQRFFGTSRFDPTPVAFHRPGITAGLAGPLFGPITPSSSPLFSTSSFGMAFNKSLPPVEKAQATPASIFAEVLKNSPVFNQAKTDESMSPASSPPVFKRFFGPVITPSSLEPASPRLPSLFESLPTQQHQLFNFASPIASDMAKSDVIEATVEEELSTPVDLPSPVIDVVSDMAKSDTSEVASEAEAEAATATKTTSDSDIENSPVVVEVPQIDLVVESADNTDEGSSLEAVSKASELLESEQLPDEEEEPTTTTTPTSSGGLILESVKPFVLRPSSSISSSLQHSLAEEHADQGAEELTSDIHHRNSSFDEVKGLVDEKVEEDSQSLEAVLEASELRNDMMKDVQREDVLLQARKNLAKGRLTQTLQKVGIELPDVKNASVEDMERLVELAQSKTKSVNNSRSMALCKWIMLFMVVLSLFLLCLAPFLEKFVASPLLLGSGRGSLSRTSLYHANKLQLDLPQPQQIDKSSSWFKSPPTVSPAVRHPCIDFLRAQKEDLAALYSEEQDILHIVHDSLTPSIPQVLAGLEKPTLAQLVELKTTIAETSQRFANIDRKIGEHLHRQREGSAVCVKLPHSAPVTLVPGTAAVTPPPGPKSSRPASSRTTAVSGPNNHQAAARTWLSNMSSSIVSALPSHLLAVFSPASPESSLVPSSVVPSAPRYVTQYDAYFMGVERELRRSQRGYRFFQGKLRTLSADVSFLAGDWLERGEMRVLEMLEDWVGGVWEGSGMV